MKVVLEIWGHNRYRFKNKIYAISMVHEFRSFEMQIAVWGWPNLKSIIGFALKQM